MKKLLYSLLLLTAFSVIAQTENGITYFAIKDYNGTKLELDPKKYMVTIDIEHHKIHEGELFEASYYTNDLDNASPIYLNVIVPAGKNPHVVCEIMTSAEVLVQQVGTNYNTPITTLTTYNRNNTVSTTSTVTCNIGTVAVAGSTNAVSLIGANGGGASRAGGTYRSGEIIMSASKTNSWKITSQADNTRVVVKAIWYE